MKKDMVFASIAIVMNLILNDPPFYFAITTITMELKNSIQFLTSSPFQRVQGDYAMRFFFDTLVEPPLIGLLSTDTKLGS